MAVFILEMSHRQFDSVIYHLQYTGTIAGLGLIAMDDKILVYLRAVIMKGMLRTVQRYVRIGHKPLFVAIAEDLIERAVQHFFHRNPLHFLHFRIAIAKNEIHTAAVLVKDKLYHTKCQRHIIQKAAFFQHTQRTWALVLQSHFRAQTAVAAQTALAPLKGAAIRHGINTIAANIYNVAAAYHCPFADIQELTLRQNSQNTADRNEQCKFFIVRTFDNGFAIFTVNIQDIFRTKSMLLKICVQVGHVVAPFPP